MDTNCSQEGAIDQKPVELVGLSASMVLRCDDCIRYHIGSAISSGASEKELIEVFEISSLVGGSIVIPHLRRAFEYMDMVFNNEEVTAFKGKM